MVQSQYRACMPVYIGKSGDLVGWHRCLTDRQQKIGLLSFSTVSSLSWVTQCHSPSFHNDFHLPGSSQSPLLSSFSSIIKGMHVPSHRSHCWLSRLRAWSKNMEWRASSLWAPDFHLVCHHLWSRHLERPTGNMLFYFWCEGGEWSSTQH